MLAKFDGRCACGNRFLAGTEITYDRTTRKVTACASCKSTKLAEALERAEEPAEPSAELGGESLDALLPETAEANYIALMKRLDPAQLLIAGPVAGWRPKDGNLRVVAAAGSGKTTTSVALIARLIRTHEVPAGRIVATTFTSKAGKELVDRLLQVLPPGAISESPNGSKDQMRAGTFHSIALRALRHAEPNVWRLGKCIDLPEKSRDKGIPSASILWNRVLGWGEIPGLPADVKGLDLEEPDVKAYQLAADVCRATGASGDELDKLIATAELEQGLRGLAKAWRLVCRSKQALGAFDFADALQAYYDGLKLGTQPIHDSADVVLVDEAQDNSKVQLEIAKLLSKNGRLILVGDVRQSIYSWRGAYPDMFLHANEEIGAKTLELPTNYRSVTSVVAIGNNIARGKGWALGAEAKAHRPEAGVVEVKYHTDPGDEAEQTARAIQAALDEGAELSDFAILTRTNAFAGAYEAALVARKIPCVVVGGQPFFDRKEVKDALAYYRLSAHDDIDALARICNKPRRFLGKAFVAAVRSRMGDRSMLDAIAQVAPTLRGSSRDGAEELVATLHTLRNMEWPVVPKTIASLLAAPDAETKAGEADSDRSGIPLALAAIAQDFPSAEALCSFAVRCANEVKGVSEETMAIEGRVTISTVHKAKGLEWKHVFVSCTKGIFPHAKASNLDEELRLFYVACTRAKDHLTLSACGLDLRGKDAGPSSFLAYAPKPEGPKGPGGGAPEPRKVVVIDYDTRATREIPVEAEGRITRVPAPLLTTTPVDQAAPLTADELRAAMAGEDVVQMYATRLGIHDLDFAQRAVSYQLAYAPDPEPLSVSDPAHPDHLRYDDEGYDQTGAPHPAYDAARRAFVQGAPSIGDCTRCEGTDGPGTGNPLPCNMHPKQLEVELQKRLERAREYAQRRTDREARAVAGPGGRFVQATREDFEELLRPIGFISATADVVRNAHEHVLELGLPDKAKKGYIAIRVYTSVALGEADARELGEDAIRVSALFISDDGATVPLRKKMQRVFRTRSWRLNLLERIETVLVEVEKAPACPRCGAPMAERTAKRGNEESKFWGCVLFKPNTAYACKGTRPFEEE